MTTELQTQSAESLGTRSGREGGNLCYHRLPRWRIDCLPTCTAAIYRNGEEKPAMRWSLESDQALFDFIVQVREGFGIADRCSQLIKHREIQCDDQCERVVSHSELSKGSI